MSIDAKDLSQIGETNAFITQLGFGGASVGNLYRAISDQQAFDVLQQSYDKGIRYLDTAPHYGHGLSEVRIGKFLSGCQGQTPILSTKVGRILVPAGEDGPGDYGFVDPLPFDHIFDYSYDGILKSFDDSCERLSVDAIDILYMHDIGKVTHGEDAHPALFAEAMDGGFKAMDQLKSDGRVKAIGLGVNEWEVCMETFGHADFDVFMLAGRYTLLEQEPLDTLFTECVHRNVSIVNASPFNSGLLAKRPTKDSPYNYGAAPKDIIRRARRIFDVCDAHGCSAQAAAMQFALAHPAIAGIVSGMSQPRYITTSLAWLAEDIPNSLWSDLKSDGLLRGDAPCPSNGAAKAS
ncbi:MAG: aldo/keto reductase [Litorimonas sp.]